MNPVTIMQIWRRRWILTVFVLLVALAGSATAVVKLPKAYEAQSTVVLVPSMRTAKALGGGNPYLSFSSSLSIAADVVTTELTAPQTERELASSGYSQQYTAVSESTTGQTVASDSVLPGPFIVVTVTGLQREPVERTLQALADVIRTKLAGMQTSVPRNNWISASTVSFSPQATVSAGGTYRSLVLIIGVLVVTALCVPLIVDAQITRRRARRRTRNVPSVNSKLYDADVPDARNTCLIGDREDYTHLQAARRHLENIQGQTRVTDSRA